MPEWGAGAALRFSGLLLAISIWIRLKLTESPAFLKIKAEGKDVEGAARRNLSAQWKNLKIVHLGAARGRPRARRWFGTPASSTRWIFLQTFLKVDGSDRPTF